MRIAMIGTGYVGLVSGACFSEFGMTVTCVDNDAAKIERLHNNIMPIYEPGLDELVANNVAAGRLFFTTNLKDAVADAAAVFIGVGTPSRRGDGHADLSFVYAAAEEIADAMTGYTVVVTKSTVPVGTGDEVERVIRARRPDAEFDVVSNPEFLREGSAISDFMRPDRVVIGTDSERARAVMKQLYRVLYLIEAPIVFTARRTSELIKYAGNSFLATKITFINELADLCEAVGADVHDVAKGIGLDGRIGRKFLHPGPGFGGSCFPKDTLALVRTARDSGAPLRIVETVVAVNEERKRKMAERVIDACGGSVAGKEIALLGLTFKPNTDDMRDSPALDIVPALLAAGAKVRAFDPEGMPEAKKLLPTITYCDDATSAMDGADCLVVITEWNEFRALAPERLKALLRSPIVVDLRNVYEPEMMVEAGIRYSCIGRPVKGSTLPYRFHPTILREYDIRGIVGETLSTRDAYFIGRTFGAVVRRKGGTVVCVGRDGRVSSPGLVHALIDGLIAAGCVVKDIGLGPTPMLYFAQVIAKADGAIMVTGSHNPPSHNGFKIVLGGKSFFAKDILSLGDMAKAGDMPEESGGRVEPFLVQDDYVKRILADYNGVRPLKAVWDCGNGSGGEVVRQVVASLPGEHTVLFGDIDGAFPNHHPDPTDPKNLQDLIAAVREQKADLGFAFDGDADRIGVVDGKGRILWGDQILMFLAEEVLSRLPGSTIIADVKASETLFTRVRDLGGKALMWRTGHSLIKSKMAETGSPLAGEMSGHVFFADRYYGYDDAIYVATRFLAMVARWTGKTLTERYDDLPKAVNTPEIRVACPDEKKFAVVDAIKAKLKAEGANVNDTDGVRVSGPDGWWLLRPSNTQAVLVARCEAPDEQRLATLVANLKALLADFGVAFEPAKHE
jgi:UDPglucose 6-dehydrogenase